MAVYTDLNRLPTVVVETLLRSGFIAALFQLTIRMRYYLLTCPKLKPWPSASRVVNEGIESEKWNGHPTMDFNNNLITIKKF